MRSGQPPSCAEILTAGDAAQLEAVEAEKLSRQIGAITEGDGPHAGVVLRRCGAVIGLTEASHGRKLNHVVGLGMHDDVGAGGLADSERMSAECGVDAEIDLCPYAKPSLLPLLASRGICRHRLLQHPRKGPGPISVRPLASGEAEAFVEWSVVGFLQNPPRPETLLVCLARPAPRRADVDLYVAKLGGQVVVTAALSVPPVNGGLATHLLLASTLPEIRGRGVQAALLNRRIADARAKGAAFATITARPSNGSARNTALPFVAPRWLGGNLGL